VFRDDRVNRFHKLRILTRLIVFAWFFIGGIAHFVVPHLFASTIPPAIPYALVLVYISGFFELAGAIALWPEPTRHAAGIGLMLLTICVTPANVYMWMHPELFPNISPTMLFWRLPLQVLLLAAIWFASKASPPRLWGYGRL
jgi:uncharacterized membrane protein